RGEKALVIYGSSHIVRRRFGLWASAAESIASTVTKTFKAVQVNNPGRVFVVGNLAGPNPSYEKLETLLQARERPLLLSLIGTPAANLTLDATMTVNGKKVTVTSKPGDAFDACVYFGNTADVATMVEPDPALYRDTPYGAEIARRRKIMETRR